MRLTVVVLLLAGSAGTVAALPAGEGPSQRQPTPAGERGRGRGLGLCAEVHAAAQIRTPSLSRLFSCVDALPKTGDVKHIISDFEDVPPLPCLMDRRIHVDRREIWRGGRRDSDWTSRPPNAWETLDTTDRPPRWHAVLSTLHLLT